VLDPETGEMIPAGGDDDEEIEEVDEDGAPHVVTDDAPVVIKLGQLSKKSSNSTQDSNSVPKLKINLGSRIESGSNGGLSHENRHSSSSSRDRSSRDRSSSRHHKSSRKHKKKKKRYASEDEEDDDIIELNSDSD